MKIKEMLWQNRRDFKAMFECEHCGFTEIRTGYDDDFFHNTVVPNIKCFKCGKTASDTYEPREPRYKDWEIV